MRRRTAKDIWQNLHEFYLVETTSNPEWNKQKIKNYLLSELSIKDFTHLNIVTAKPQTLTHRQVFGYFIIAELNNEPEFLKNISGEWLSQNEIKTKAFPRFIHQYFSAKNALSQVLLF